MSTRERLSATVRADLLAVGRAAVADGRAESLSSWVDQALQRQVEHEHRMQAAAEFFADYEAEHGVITEEEMAEARENDRARAISVRVSGVA